MRRRSIPLTSDTLMSMRGHYSVQTAWLVQATKLVRSVSTKRYLRAGQLRLFVLFMKTAGGRVYKYRESFYKAPRIAAVRE